ncbi:NitT/TauT family transport system permease protein [Aureimonas altamirensis DSM 21988]|uniref:ABC transporter inner membrane protein n=2 Tax=Aureimonas altamirensis TaxID=370622 RepID=A0A0P0YWX7_9HYPH|nr:ABC transporter inner membrane protein [Aureimonas altamirensis]SHI78070.1 NitT/TauT family transport system permease protein [Aureimonas altamirensis DSM 21988]
MTSYTKTGEAGGVHRALDDLLRGMGRVFDRVPALWSVASLAVLCTAWQIAGLVPISFAFPTFTDTFAAFLQMLFDGSLIYAFFITLQPLVLGVAISATLGVGLGVLMGLSPKAEWFFAPVFIVLQAAPMAALVPLVTFVYGIGLTAKTLAVIMLALPVIALNSYKAVRHVNPSLVAMCRSFQGTRMQRVFKIIIPDASPVIFAGLRLGVAAGYIGVMLAELLITPTGIGDLITYHRSVADYAHMYAAVASIIVLSMLTLVALQRIETRYLRPERRSA